MAKVSFTNMKLKMNTETISVKIGDSEIEVLQYLPIEDKYDLIENVIQNSLDNGIYNTLKLDMYLDLYLVYLYTNINFTEKQKEDEIKLYNILESNGIIETIIEKIPVDEYNTIYECLQEEVAKKEKFDKSVAGILNKFINDLPAQAEAMQDIINNFDPSKYQQVIDFATAANGGRPIDG